MSIKEGMDIMYRKWASVRQAKINSDLQTCRILEATTLEEANEDARTEWESLPEDYKADLNIYLIEIDDDEPMDEDRAHRLLCERGGGRIKEGFFGSTKL